VTIVKITRRELASALTVGAALAQTPAPPLTREAELQAARDQLKITLARLSAEAVPMTTEPAFQFKP
jgi:hypothetical protein